LSCRCSLVLFSIGSWGGSEKHAMVLTEPAFLSSAVLEEATALLAEDGRILVLKLTLELIHALVCTVFCADKEFKMRVFDCPIDPSLTVSEVSHHGFRGWLLDGPVHVLCSGLARPISCWRT
jgi:hypothetical protein